MLTLVPNTRKEVARRKRAYAKRAQVLNLKKLIAKLEQPLIPRRPRPGVSEATSSIPAPRRSR